MKISIGYITARAQPHVEWMLEGLAAQKRNDDEIELIVVDAYGRSPQDLVPSRQLADVVTKGIVTRPRPNIWQGPHRVTSCDWWAKATAINTFFVLATHDYVACVDDRCRLSPEWLATVRQGERERTSVLAGSYDRLEDDRVTMDSRRTSHPRGHLACGGAWLYGCTWALPLEWALEINGFEEGTDGLGGEDYIFGLMLTNARRRVDFVPSMRVELERSVSANAGASSLMEGGISPMSSSPKRTDKGVSPNDKSHAALERFRKLRRTEFTPDLRELREKIARGEPWPLPDPSFDWTDWYDGQLVREM